MSEPKLKRRQRIDGYEIPGRVHVELATSRFYVDCECCGNPDTRSEPCEHEMALWEALPKETP